jgi:hypothetical protein
MAGRQQPPAPPAAQVQHQYPELGPDPLALLSQANSSEPHEPQTYAEAKKDHRSSEWQQAMKEEVDSLTQNKTWKLTKLPANCRPLRGK